jgi:alkylhydroperoxidase family enzyme
MTSATNRAALDRALRHAGHVAAAVAAGRPRQVADHEHLGRARHGKRGVDLDPAGAIERRAKLGPERRRLHAGRPQHRARG